MEKKFLEIGDVFAVGYGMKVYCTVDGDEGETDHTIFPSEFDMLPHFRKWAKELPQFVNNNDALAFIKLQYAKTLTHQEKTRPFCGNYVVIEAYMDGGGQGGHRSNDIYPNGHHVFAKKLNHDGTFNPNGLEINFYQSGCFTAKNENVPVIRKMAPSFA